MTIHQYARSTDPEVVAVIERNDAKRDAFHEAAIAFAREHGDAAEPAYFGDSTHLTAIASATKPTSGQWTRVLGGRGWRPYKSNPLMAQMMALTPKLEPVPGLPRTAVSPANSDGLRYRMWPTPFVLDGVAWLTLGHAPAQTDDSFGEQWTEVLASEALTARERWAAVPAARD